MTAYDRLLILTSLSAYAVWRELLICCFHMLLGGFDPEMMGFALERKTSLMKFYLCAEEKMFKNCYGI